MRVESAAARVGAQHSQNYGPWYASVPGLIVIAPYDAADAKGLMKAAIRSEDPVVFLENELVYGRSFDVPKLDDYVLPIGKARIMKPGKDVTLVSYSIGVGVALEAAETLAGEGIDAEVIDLRTLRPLDTDTVLESLKKTNRIVVVEEGWPTCSIASEIAAVVMEKGFDDLDAPVLRVTNEDVPLPYANNLEKAALIDTPRVVTAVKAPTRYLRPPRPRSRSSSGPCSGLSARGRRAEVLAPAPAARARSGSPLRTARRSPRRSTPHTKGRVLLRNSTFLDTLPPRVATAPRPLPRARNARAHSALARYSPPLRATLLTPRRASCSPIPPSSPLLRLPRALVLSISHSPSPSRCHLLHCR